MASMNREQEEAVLRITADYVAEIQAGNLPSLSDYLARYPQYADAITEFVTYYHAVEVDIPGEAPAAHQLSEQSRKALARAWERVLLPGNVSAGPLTNLLVIAGRQHLSLAELAIKLGLSQDIAEKIERGMIVATTIPQEVLRSLASLLQQPFSVILTSFDLSGQHSVGEMGGLMTRIAESPPFYQAEGRSDLQAQSFREAVEQSVQLSGEQKAKWRDILTCEGL
jgi:transcriptional regulator with XRE-family HTH domain